MVVLCACGEPSLATLFRLSLCAVCEPDSLPLQVSHCAVGGGASSTTSFYGASVLCGEPDSVPVFRLSHCADRVSQTQLPFQLSQ